ncbi:MAG: hypothetical protein AWT59_2368 [Candidatus Gallionella acididurans]|uniref:Uncharacterized protein n=1 Tax=Candidatus Gallionella acididurans TaxID=1796491 RepID=A0A139BRB4_9PROT|nr:MAG: hypothetical protein AWT59_2368 [Candidatus Gallionella acididurans]
MLLIAIWSRTMDTIRIAKAKPNRYTTSMIKKRAPEQYAANLAPFGCRMLRDKAAQVGEFTR